MKPKNSKDKNKSQISEKELRLLDSIINSHKKLLAAIGKL